MTGPASVGLHDSTPAIDIGGDIYLTPDPEKKLDARIVAARHENNLRGRRMDGPVINLGPGMQPAWMVFSVTNSSATEDWFLHFGTAAGGRMALASALTVYDYTDNRMILETGDGAKGWNEDLQGAALPVKISRNQTSVFVLYLEPAAGLAQTIRPSLIRNDHYIKTLRHGGFPDFPAGIFLTGAIGFFAAISFVRKNLSWLLPCAWYGLHALLFTAMNALFFTSSAFTGDLVIVLYAVCILGIPLITKTFLDITIEQHTQNSFLLTGGMTVVLATLLNIFFISPDSFIDEFLIYAPAVLAPAASAWVSFLQGQQGRPAGYYLAFAWLSALGGSLITGLTASGVIPAGVYTINAYALSLLPQSFFLIAGTAARIRISEEEERHMRSRESRTAKSLARLMHSKESADQARLLRVIERERELMAELREREMQRTEEMRRAKEMADEANRAKSAFLAVVSHEIRTPMTGILGMTRLLSNTKLTREQTDYTQAMQKSGETMLALLNDILDFEKIERGSMELENIDFDLPRLVQGVATLMSGHATDKGLYIRADIPDGFPHYVVGDPTRLRQVLLNLVGNAIKFTDTGGVTIRLRAEKIKKSPHSLPQDRYEIGFAVEDTGIGISPEGRKNMFSPFAQADKTVSRKYGGTGLGLAISRRLVEAMGGSIDVKSTEGQGSTFFFSFPMQKGRKESAEVFEKGRSRQRPPVPSLRLLIIEDNEMNRKVFQGFLEKEGHKVAAVRSGNDGLDALKKDGFDAVFTDINLAGMSGFEVIQAIRSNPDPKISALPVMAITGNVTPEDIENYFRSGFNGFIPKPVDPDMLEEALRRVHNGDFEKKTTPEKRTSKTIRDIIDSGDDADTDFEISVNSSGGDGFDKNMLGQLLETLGYEELEGLIRGFLDKTDEIVGNLETLKTPDNDKDIRDRAHELKGMSANFGVIELSVMAGEIEKAARTQDLKAALDKIPLLRQESRKARNTLERWLRQTKTNL